MPLTDAYEWIKTNTPQDIMNENPYSNYQYNYINDINSGIYQNSSLTLIQHDLSSIFNSSVWTNTASHFLVIPIVRTCEAFATNNHVNLTDKDFYLTSIKNGNASLIHQIDMQINGSVVQQLSPFHGIWSNIKLASELSDDDLNLMGASLGLLELDNPNSMTYQTTATNYYSTPGIANNYVNGTPYLTVNSATVTAGQTPGSGLSNGAIQRKILLNKILSTASRQNLSAINNSTSAQSEFLPSFEISSSGVAIWKDYCIIFMKDIVDAMNHIGMVRRLDGILRIYVNTGFVSCGGFTNGQMIFDPQYSTFSDVCPLMINNISNSLTSTDSIPAATVTSLNCGLFVARPPNYTFVGYGGNGSSNFSTTPGSASAMVASRYYFNQITVNPSLALEYMSANNNKEVIYDSMLYNTFVNIGQGANFSQLIQSGISNIKAILIMPLISKSQIGFSGFSSPFDPCGGMGGHPISLTNLQIAVGGTNQFSTSLSYTFETFVEQLSKFNKQSSSEYGVESGLWSYQYWLNNRLYLCNVRSTEDDLNTPRNVTISFKNNSLVAIDIIVFCVYDTKLTINVSTGIVSK